MTEGLKTFNAAVTSGDPRRIAQAAGQLNNQISAAPMMFGTQNPFGCYDPAILSTLQLATSTFSSTLDGISGAATSLSGKSPPTFPVSP